jgi:hypothetical protein
MLDLGDGLAVDGLVAERRREARDHGVEDRPRVGFVAQKLRERRHAAVGDAARDDVVEHREVGIDVEGEAVARAPTCDLDADRGDLLGVDPHAGEPRLGVGFDPEIGQRADEHGLELAHVGHDIAETVAPRGKRDDRIADELARAVIGDVAAAVGVHELRTHGVGRDEHVLAVGARPERVDVRVLEQEQVVVAGLAMQRALEVVRLRVGHPAQLAHPQPVRAQSSSASQSRVSRSVRTAFRNAAAYAPSNAR